MMISMISMGEKATMPPLGQDQPIVPAHLTVQGLLMDRHQALATDHLWDQAALPIMIHTPVPPVDMDPAPMMIPTKG